MALPPRRVAESGLIRQLRALGALSPETAQPFEPFGLVQRRQVDRLLAKGAIHQVAGGRYYLDEAGYARFQTARRRIGVPVAIAALIVVALLLALS